MFHPRLAGVFLVLLLLPGCVNHYVPTASRPFEPIPEFASNHAISLRNGQSSTEIVTIARNAITGAKAIDGNLQVWTDTAIEIAARELKNRGMAITGDTPKTLTLSITQAVMEIGFVHIETRITMQVSTNDGYAATYTGVNSSAVAAIPSRQIDGAMMRVVRAMLLDPRIVNFLTR